VVRSARLVHGVGLSEPARVDQELDFIGADLNDDAGPAGGLAGAIGTHVAGAAGALGVGAGGAVEHDHYF
jgi:hypothetical protein